MNLKQRTREYRNRVEETSFTDLARENWHIGVLASIVFTALMLRYMPENGMKYLQAADPYFIFRNAQHLALGGNLPQVDFHRYFPYTSPTYLYNNGDFVIPALLWDAGFSLVFPSFLEWAQFYPAMLGAGSVLVMYFLGKELFNRKTGLAAAFFLAVIPAALRRTSAGFFEKEPIGTFLMMVSLLFFTRAWKQESWKNGILSGLALGLFTVSWGGSQMLWLLYPLVTGGMLFINEEIRPMIAAYTPTVLIAGFFAAAWNPANFWFNDSLFLFSMAVLGGLWLRYLVGEFEIVSESYLPYFIPSLSILGGVMAILSPIYSDFVARKMLGVIRKAVGATATGVIGGTVAENAPPPASSLASNLGSLLIGGANPVLETLALILSPWNLMLFSLTFISTSMLVMLGRKYEILGEELSGRKHIAYIQSVFVAVLIAAAGLVVNLIAVSILAAVVIGVSLLAVVHVLDDESSYSISALLLGGTVIASLIFVFRFSSGIFSPEFFLITVPAAVAATASVILYWFELFPKKKIEFRWHLVIPLMWIVSNVYGGTTRSRLVFLSSFAVALGAGHGAAVAYEKIREIDYSLVDAFDAENLKMAVSIVLVVSLVGMNFFSGFAMSQGIRGSPSPSPQVWEPSLDFMNQTPPGSVILSWWDYGYLFEELGNRAAVADGMNAGYYSQEIRAVNMPLARYLNTTNRPQDRRFLKKHSADYIWLDHSMIGKFSAVSQIAHRSNNQYQVISQVGTPGTLRNSLSTDGNQTVVEFRGRIGRTTLQIFAPLEISNSSMSLTGPATVRFANGQTAKIGCVLTEEGKKKFDVEREMNYCIAEDPFYTLERGAAGGQARAVLVPKRISDSTFVELYIQDGAQLEYAEKVPEASNGYIKMWKIDL